MIRVWVALDQSLAFECVGITSLMDCGVMSARRASCDVERGAPCRLRTLSVVNWSVVSPCGATSCPSRLRGSAAADGRSRSTFQARPAWSPIPLRAGTQSSSHRLTSATRTAGHVRVATGLVSSGDARVPVRVEIAVVARERRRVKLDEGRLADRGRLARSWSVRGSAREPQ